MDFVRVDIMVLRKTGVTGAVGYWPVDQLVASFGLEKGTEMICVAMHDWVRNWSECDGYALPCQWSYRGVSLRGERAEEKLKWYSSCGPNSRHIFRELPVRMTPWGDMSNG